MEGWTSREEEQRQGERDVSKKGLCPTVHLAIQLSPTFAAAALQNGWSTYFVHVLSVSLQIALGRLTGECVLLDL